MYTGVQDSFIMGLVEILEPHDRVYFRRRGGDQEIFKIDGFIDFKRQHMFTDHHIHVYIYTKVLCRDS